MPFRSGSSTHFISANDIMSGALPPSFGVAAGVGCCLAFCVLDGSCALARAAAERLAAASMTKNLFTAGLLLN
jgi:hypothetical protein